MLLSLVTLKCSNWVFTYFWYFVGYCLMCVMILLARSCTAGLSPETSERTSMCAETLLSMAVWRVLMNSDKIVKIFLPRWSSWIFVVMKSFLDCCWVVIEFKVLSCVVGNCKIWGFGVVVFHDEWVWWVFCGFCRSACVVYVYLCVTVEFGCKVYDVLEVPSS